MKSVKIERKTWEEVKHLAVDMDMKLGEVIDAGIKLLKEKFDAAKP